MNTNKALLLFLALCVFSTVFMVDAKAGVSPATYQNLAGNQSDWSSSPNGYSYYVHFLSDGSIMLSSRTEGKPDLAPYCREIYTNLFHIRLGQSVYFKVHIKSDAWAGATPQNDYSRMTGGGRQCIDYRDSNGHILSSSVCSMQGVYGNPGTISKGESYIQWGKEGDLVIYDTPPAGVNTIAADLQVRPPNTGNSNVAFSNFQLYILNPGEVPPSPSQEVPPSPSLVDSYAIANQNDATLLTAVHPSSTNARSAGGQCFRGLAGYKLTSAQFALGKIGSPAGNLVAVLYALTGTFGTNGRPTGAALATSNTVAMSSIGGMAFYTFTFPQPYTLSNGHYCIAIQVSSGYSFNGNNCILIGYDNSSPTHAGNYFIYANNAWTGYRSLDGCFSVSFTS
jgi:hypothetical protein